MNHEEVFKEFHQCNQEWGTSLANPNWATRSNRIAWPQYNPAIFHSINQDVINQLASNRQYSFQHADGSLFQMVYQFGKKGRILERATLAFYQNTSPADLDEYEEEPDEEKEELDPEKPSWLRVDFAPNSEAHTLHSECHVHFSGFPNMRIALNGVPGPRQFVETIMAWFYPSHYRALCYGIPHRDRAHRLISVNRMSVPLNDLNSSRGITHFSLPESVRALQHRT